MTVRLTAAEQEIFNLLEKERGEAVHVNDLGAILDTLRKPGYISNTWNHSNLVAVHIGNLRRKLGKSETIQTVKGMGYKLV